MTTRLAQTLYALGVVAVLLTVTTGRAATPSFDSFDTNDFRVVKTTAPWKILSNTANTTNNFTNVVVNYINSTIINTNVVVTNVNSTIVNTNTTIINQGDTIINTNTTIQITTNVYIVNITTNLEGLWVDTLGDYSPAQADQNTLHATNIYSMQTLHSSGALIFDAAATYNFLAPTNVCINPFNLGYLLIDGATTNASDTQIRLEPGNGNGAILFIQNIDEGYGFHMLNGDTLCSDPTEHLYLKGGDWYSTHEGETILLLGTPRGWAEIGRFGGPTNFVTGDLWQVVGGVLQPVDLTLQPMIQNGLSVGTNTLALWGSNLTNGEVIVSTSNPDLGDPDSKVIDLSVLNSAVVGTRFNLQLHTNYTRMQNWNKAVPAGTLNLLEWTVDTNETYLDLQIAGAIRTVLRPNTSTSTVPFQVDSALPRYGSAAPIMTFGNYGTNMLSVNWNGGLIFGPGSTNVLYRRGNDLVLTNASGGTAGLRIATVDGTESLFTSSGNTAIIQGITAVSLRDQFNDSAQWSSKRFWPLQSASILGGDLDTSPRTPWSIINSQTNYIWGYMGSGTTNYSRLFVTHTGTNGAVVFDSQSSGNAGQPRPFYWDWNGTNIVQLENTDVLGSSQVFFKVINSLGATSLFGTTSGGHAIMIAGAGKNVYFGANNNGSGDYLMTSTAFLPVSPDATNTLGTAQNPWGDIYGRFPNYTPANSSETNHIGQITWDTNNLYIWTATNVNKKVPLTSW